MKPFNDREINILQIIQEFITSLCYTLTILFLFDIGDINRNVLQYIIIGLIILNFASNLIFMLYDTIKNLLKRSRNPHSLNKTYPTISIENPESIQPCKLRMEETYITDDSFYNKLFRRNKP